METFALKYQQLCEVRILHHYFLDTPNTLFDDLPVAEQGQRLANYDARNWLDIQPDTDTSQTLHDYRLVFKKTPEGFRIMAQVTAPNQPIIKLDDLKLIFPFRFKNGASGYSALPINIIKNNHATTYIFGNELAANNSGAAPSLALTPAAYSNSRLYPPGEIVRQGGTNYMALLQADNQGKSISDTDYWLPLPSNVRYANPANAQEITADHNTQFIGQFEIDGQPGMGNFSVLDGSGHILSRVFELRINKLSIL